MLYRVCEIKREHGYTFLIGSESTPTNRLRDQIGEALAGIWATLFEGEKEKNIAGYGFELIPDKSPPTGESELPTLKPGDTYVIFILLESGTGSAVGGEEITRGIHRAIERSLSGSEMKPRIGVLVLYNCSVQVLETKHYGAVFLPPVIHKSPFDDDYPRSWGDRRDPFGGF